MKFNPTRLAILLVASLFIFSNSFSQKERLTAYINQYKDLAMQEMVRTGIPASITLAQGLLETGFGQSQLAVNANNHFGIKCKGDWMGEKIYHDDDTKDECFRKYSSAVESYRDHSDFLKTRPNYKNLFTLDVTDYKGWAKGLKAAGYATNPEYPQRIIKLIEENNLHQYTLLALDQKGNSSTETFTAATVKEEEKIEVSSTLIKEEPVEASGTLAEEIIAIKLEPQTNTEVPNNYPAGTFTINDTKVLFAEVGTSLFALATNNNISFNKLLEFNDLGKVDILEKSQLIFLQKKQKRGSKDVHIAEANEDLHEIAQKEGVQLSSVLEFNNLHKGEFPFVGQKIYLKAASPVSTKNLGTTRISQSSSTMR